MAEMEITVLDSNQNPSANFQSSGESLEIEFDAAQSMDPENKVLTYLWLIEDQTYTQEKVTHVFSQAGTFEVSLTVTDVSGAKDILLKQLNVSALNTDPTVPTDPTAIIAMNIDGLSVTFNASNSSGVESEIIKYQWVIEGGIYSDKIHNHIFSQPAIYPVMLMVTDENGLTNSVIENVTITVVVMGDDIDPIADFEFIVDGLDVSFDAALSYDADSSITQYEWLIEQIQYTDKTFDYSFDAINSYEVQLTVTDEYANTATITKTVDVFEIKEPNRAPLASIFRKFNNDAYITLDGSNSFDQDSDDLIYSWQLSDGTVFNGSRFTYEATSTASIDAVLFLSDGKDVSEANYVIMPGSSSINRSYDLELYDAVTTYLSCAAKCHSGNHPFSQDYSLSNSDQQIRGLINKYGVEQLYKYPVGLSNHQGNDVLNGDVILNKWRNLVRLVDADVNANNLPVEVDFSYEISDKTVTFTNTSVDPEDATLTFEWDFGDFFDDTNEHVTHTFKENRDYIIKLTVSDGNTYQFVSKKIEL